jgi:hypothetical protein
LPRGIFQELTKEITIDTSIKGEMEPNIIEPLATEQ